MNKKDEISRSLSLLELPGFIKDADGVLRIAEMPSLSSLRSPKVSVYPTLIY